MTPHSLPGWDVVEDDGTLIATRQTKLTEYQRLNGALTEITARTEGELWILVDAQTRYAERLATAEQIRPKVKPAPGRAEAVKRLIG